MCSSPHLIFIVNNLKDIYKESNYEDKRSIIGVIFPEKIKVSKNECRTTKINEVLRLLCDFSEGISENKKGTKSENSDLSPSVPGAGLEPARPNGHKILSLACLPIPPPGQKP